MDKLNWKELDQIPIPEGLEDRLSAQIDEWEQNEKQTKARRLTLPKAVRYTSIAASIVLVFGLGFYFLHHQETVNLAEQDTYHNPAVAQLEAERALNLLAANLNKGMGQLEKAKAISDRTEQTLNKQLNIMK